MTIPRVLIAGLRGQHFFNFCPYDICLAQRHSKTVILAPHGGGIEPGTSEIARALAIEPEVLLMDEPASALDPKATAKIEDLIDQLCNDYTIVIVTHNMQQAARVSDVTAFFYEGNLIESGSTERIFTKPQRKETEDYITGRFG